MRWLGKRGVAATVLLATIVTGGLLATPAAAQPAAAVPACGAAAAGSAAQQGCGAQSAARATVTKTVFVRKGDWRTLETFFNASGVGVFQGPAGAQIKVRFGVGIFGFDRQKQTLDGTTVKRLSVSKGASLARARMQIKVSRDSEVTYTIILPGP